MRKLVLSQKDMSQDGTEPAIDSFLQSLSPDTVTVTAQPDSASMTLMHALDFGFDADQGVISEFGDMRSVTCEYSEQSVSKKGLDDGTSQQVWHSEVESGNYGLGSDMVSKSPPCNADWSPILPSSLPPVLPPGNLPLSLPETSIGETSMCVHGAQPFHAEMPNAEAL